MSLNVRHYLLHLLIIFAVWGQKPEKRSRALLSKENVSIIVSGDEVQMRHTLFDRAKTNTGHQEGMRMNNADYKVGSGIFCRFHFDHNRVGKIAGSGGENGGSEDVFRWGNGGRS